MRSTMKVAMAVSRTIQTNAPSSQRLIYTTPSALLVKLAKVFSISTLTLSSISTPALMYFWESPAVQSTGLNEYLFLTALAASTCSTGALHFLLSPFISSIYLHDNNKHRVNIIDNNGSDSKSSTTSIITPKTTITLETMDLFARPKLTTVQLQDLKPSTRSLLTWTCTKQYLANHPETSPGRFWLDKRGGVGDQNAMRQIVQVIEKQDKRNRIL